MLDCVFAPPLSPDQTKALASASRIVLLRPDDLFIMCGGVAHTTLTISDDELNVTSYESIVTLAPTHARHFLRTSCKAGPFALPRGAMPSDELDEFKEAVVDAIEAMVDEPNPDFATALVDLQKPARIALETLLRELLSDCVDTLVRNDSYFAENITPKLRKAVERLTSAPLYNAVRDARSRRR